MIALGETDESAAEIPFFLPTVADPTAGLTGHSFTLGEVVRRLPADSAFANATLVKLLEVGFGWYVERLTSTETLTAGMAVLQAVVAGAQPYTGTEQIGSLGGDIPQNGDGTIGFYAANATDPVFGTPVSVHDFTADVEYDAGTGTTSLVQLRLPNGSFANAKVSDIVALNNGTWGLNIYASASQTARKGKAFIYAAVPGAKAFTGYVTILGAGIVLPGGGGTSSGTPVVANTHVPVANPASAPVDHVAGALSRLCEQFKAKASAQ